MAKKRITDSFDLERRAFNGDEKAQRILERRRKEYNKQLNTVARSRVNDLTRNSNITPPEKQGWTAEDEIRRKADVKKYMEEKKLKELDEERKKHEEGEGQWITVKGRHVFIKKGQTVMGALLMSRDKQKSSSPLKNTDPLKNSDNPNDFGQRLTRSERKARNRGW